MPRSKLTFIAIACWTILLAAVCIKPLFAPTSGTVFITYLKAGEEFSAGRPLYNVIHQFTDNYRYPPIVAVGFVPFTLLPPGFGSVVWRLFGVAGFLTGLAAWARHLRPDVSLPLLFLLAIPLSIGSLSNAQANTHVAGLMLWGSVLACRGNWFSAALLVAAATTFKGYPIALGGLLALLAPVRFGLPLILGVAAGFALPYAFQSPEYITTQYQLLFDNLGNDDRSSRPLFAGYQDFHMLLRVFGINIPRNDYAYVQAATGLAAAGLILWLRFRGMSRSDAALNALAIGLCWMCVFNPAIEASTYILMAPLMAFELVPARRPLWVKLAAYSGGGLFLLSVIVFAFPHAIHQPVIALGVLPMGAALIAIATIARTVMSRPALATPATTAEPPLRQAA